MVVSFCPTRPLGGNKKQGLIDQTARPKARPNQDHSLTQSKCFALVTPFIMCVMCFNSQWRSVLIGSTGASLALAVVWITAVYQDEVELYLGLDLKKFGCLAVDQDETSTWTWKMNNKHCVLLFFWACFPIPLWLVLAGYVVNHVVLAIGAGIRSGKQVKTVCLSTFLTFLI